MRLASWNVNSIRARLPLVLSWLKERDPDILLLQELKTEDFPLSAFQAEGYNAVFVGQKSWNGVAIVFKSGMAVGAEADSVRALPGDESDTQSRYLEMDIAGLRVICLYLPNGNPVDTEKFSYKLEWMARLNARISTLRAQRVPFIIGGDFNVIPEPEDCHDPALWTGDALFDPEVRARYRALIHSGLTDAFRVFEKGGGHYTFWDYQGQSWPLNRGIRIDHFLLSPPIADRLTACTIDTTPRSAEKASDHTPIVVEIGDI